MPSDRRYWVSVVQIQCGSQLTHVSHRTLWSHRLRVYESARVDMDGQHIFNTLLLLNIERSAFHIYYVNTCDLL